MILTRGGFVLVLIVCASFAYSEVPVTLCQADLRISVNLDEYMTALSDAGRFDGTVLVARGDVILLSKGYGIANCEFSVPVETGTVFAIGSNTKQFTAAAVMILQEQGMLDINDPVSMYVTDSPPQWQDIRIHHLLNHKSGIPSEGAYDSSDPEDIPLPDLVKSITELPLSFQPGTDMTYSNNGYITLSCIIEQASGMSYDQYLRENIFIPAGMTDTGHDNARDVFTGRASGYTSMAGRRIHYERQNTHNRYGAGALHSTTEDIFRWIRAFYTSDDLLCQGSREAMIENDYGLVKSEWNGRTLISHGGRAVGFISFTLYCLEEEITILFLSNYDRTPLATLPKDLLSIVFGEPYLLPEVIQRMETELTPRELEQYTGQYSLAWESSWTFDVFVESGRLFYTSSFPSETVELFFEGDDTFFVTPESADSFIFTRDENGNITGFRMYTMEGVFDQAVLVQ
jgi:CubicO group peptidase (beta-lactamase class C family)